MYWKEYTNMLQRVEMYTSCSKNSVGICFNNKKGVFEDGK